MVQSKEDVRNRWERSTLEREERKWERRGEREGEGRTEGGIDREREKAVREKHIKWFPMKAPGCTHLTPHRLVCADV